MLHVIGCVSVFCGLLHRKVPTLQDYFPGVRKELVITQMHLPLSGACWWEIPSDGGVRLHSLFFPGSHPLRVLITWPLLLASYQLGLAGVRLRPEITEQEEGIGGISSLLPPCICIASLAVFASFQDYSVARGFSFTMSALRWLWCYCYKSVCDFIRSAFHEPRAHLYKQALH